MLETNENLSLQSRPSPHDPYYSSYSVSYAIVNDTNATKRHISMYLTEFNLKKKKFVII